MNDNPAQQVLSDLFGYLESLEAQSGAISQFLKERGIATDEQLAPYLKQASDAANVKWRAARVRMEHLFAVSDQAPAPAEHRPKVEGVTKENKDESSTLRTDSEARPGRSNEPAKQNPADAGTGDDQSSKEKEVDARASAGAPVSPEQKTSGDSEKQKTSGDSERSNKEQQKAS
jgi:hypothetical protein